ncbi:Copper amine oxidase, N2 domain, partial [Halorubrum vacuolatum]
MSFGQPEEARHPLTPLTESEVEAAWTTVEEERSLSDDARAIEISLAEPSVEALSSFHSDGSLPERRAKVVARDKNH